MLRIEIYLEMYNKLYILQDGAHQVMFSTTNLERVLSYKEKPFLYLTLNGFAAYVFYGFIS